MVKPDQKKKKKKAQLLQRNQNVKHADKLDQGENPMAAVYFHKTWKDLS